MAIGNIRITIMKTIPHRRRLCRHIASRPAPARAIMLAALLAATFLANGAAIEDGFYSKSEDASGQAAIDQNGRPLVLGKKQTLQINETTLYALDNANTQFELRVKIPNEGDQARATEVLAIGGKVYARNGWGSSAQGAELMFPFSGADNAKAVAGYFWINVTYRKHPGYNMAVSFAPSKPEFEIGDEVKVTLRIENVGSNAFAFQQGGRNRAQRDQQYTFTASFGAKQVEDIGSDMHMGGLSTDRLVRPGEVFTDTVVLNKWFAFDKPGVYRVLGSYYMDFKPTNDLNMPSRPFPQTVWEDYATGAFTIKIVPAQPR
jgi:hypothetical protein